VILIVINKLLQNQRPPGIISALSCYRHCISNDFFEGVHYDETGPGYFTWVGGYDINYHITKKD